MKYFEKAGQFVVTMRGNDIVLSDTINLSKDIQEVMADGDKHILQLVSKSAYGKIELQFLGSVFPLDVYFSDIYEYLHLMPLKKIADTSRQV